MNKSPFPRSAVEITGVPLPGPARGGRRGKVITAIRVTRGRPHRRGVRTQNGPTSGGDGSVTAVDFRVNDEWRCTDFLTFRVLRRCLFSLFCLCLCGYLRAGKGTVAGGAGLSREQVDVSGGWLTRFADYSDHR